jgi:YYY domain-containing protein
MELLLALRWYLVLQLFGLAALPLTLRLFHRMPGRGYAFARPLGLMVAGYLFWILSVFGWLPNTPGGVVAVLLLLALAGAAVWFSARNPDPPPATCDLRPATCDMRHATCDLRPATCDLRHVTRVELLFALAFALWCVVRAHMPRIETAGGEKWMEIAFLNAVLRAPRFPPHDPWLSGFAISYYYFGYVMMGMLTHLSAVPSTIAFNLGIATLFALTVTGAYGLVYALLAGEGERVARWGGLLGALMVALVGNLEGVLEVLYARGLFPVGFWKWLDIRSINGAPPPLAEGSWMPNRFMWWWQASRVLHDYAPWHTPANPAEWEVIDEFPAFSFILGDMHPHLLSLPFALLALALDLNVFYNHKDTKTRNFASLGLRGFPLYAICLGGMGFLNTWDLPVYFAVFAAAFLLSVGLENWKTVILSSILLLASCIFLYLHCPGTPGSPAPGGSGSPPGAGLPDRAAERRSYPRPGEHPRSPAPDCGATGDAVSLPVDGPPPGRAAGSGLTPPPDPLPSPD